MKQLFKFTLFASNLILLALSFITNRGNSADQKKYKAALNKIEEFVEKENVSCETKFISNENSINKIEEWLKEQWIRLKFNLRVNIAYCKVD